MKKTITLPLPTIQEMDVMFMDRKRTGYGNTMVQTQRYYQKEESRWSTKESSKTIDTSPRMPTRSLDIKGVMEVVMSIVLTTDSKDVLNSHEYSPHTINVNELETHCTYRVRAKAA
jgi:hypothetical protein